MGSQKPEITVRRPRLTVIHVLHRVGVRMLEVQVWDVAATMTFYALLSSLPASIALISILSMLGIEEQSVSAVGSLITQIFPTADPGPWERAVLTLSTTGGGLPGLVLGIAGSLISSSNGVAAYHRTMHRVYNTREGRGFLWFRLVVLGETVLLMVLFTLAMIVLLLGNEFSRRVGVHIGVPEAAFDTWSIIKWPILLLLITVLISFTSVYVPNVRLPYERLITAGSALSVLTLFGAAAALGWLLEVITSYAQVLTTLNSLIGILVLAWLAAIVLITGTIIDAEFLRARQIAAGLPAWDRLCLEPVHSGTLEYFERDEARQAEMCRSVAESARTGEPITVRRGVLVAEADHWLAVNPRPDDQAPPKESDRSG